MNITSSYYTSFLQNQFKSLQNDLAEKQHVMTTGKTFVNASENPDAARVTQQVSLARLEIEADGQRRDLASRLNEAAVLSADRATEMLESAAIAIETAYEYAFDSTDNAGLGGNVDGYIEQAVAFLNAEQDGRYLFGGSETEQEPFEIEYDVDGNITGVAYNGSTEPLEFDIGLDIRMDPTADAAMNESWVDWMNSLILSKSEFEAGNLTASEAALDQATLAKEDSFALTTDLVGKSLRIDTLNQWAQSADNNLANQEAVLQEADLNEVLLEFNQLQTTYQASMQAGSMLMNLSLLDFV